MAALLWARQPGKHRQAPAERAPSSVAFFAELLEQVTAEMAAAPMPELDMPAGQPWPGQGGAR